MEIFHVAILFVYAVGAAIMFGFMAATPGGKVSEALSFSIGWPLWFTFFLIFGPIFWIADKIRIHRALKKLNKKTLNNG